MGKPVTVVGLEGIAPSYALAAFAAVYGLRVRTDEDGTRRLTRRLFAIPTGVVGLATQARRMLPDPLLRALHEGTLQAAQQKVNSLQAPPSQDFGDAVMAPPTRRGMAAVLPGKGAAAERVPEPDVRISAILPTLHAEGVRRVQAAVEPRLKTGVGGHVPVGTLPVSARNAFALALTTKFLEGLELQFPEQVPGYIAHFDEAYLMGGPMPNPYAGGGKEGFASPVRCGRSKDECYSPQRRRLLHGVLSALDAGLAQAV